MIQSARFIMYAETTPNPLALKIVLGVPPVDHGYFLFSSLAEGKNNPVLEDILSLPGVESILLTPEFVTINKTESVPWTLLESIVMSIFQHHLGAFPLALESVIPVNADQDRWHNWVPGTPELQAVCKDIEDLIDGRIRPAVEADGGMISFCGYEDGIVYLKLQGACSSCPHSQETLTGGIEQTLRYYVPEITAVHLVL
jgi:Fe-S cluster biogenesis protein NfuA